jgi:hypothetical protein
LIWSLRTRDISLPDLVLVETFIGQHLLLLLDPRFACWRGWDSANPKGEAALVCCCDSDPSIHDSPFFKDVGGRNETSGIITAGFKTLWLVIGVATEAMPTSGPR